MEEQGHVAIVQQFGRTYRAFMAAFEAHVGHAMPRWRILRTLADAGTPCSQKRLVEYLRIDPGALTRQLKALEALGWIARSTDTRDNRITNVVLTDEGARVVEASMPQRNAFLRETMGALPDAALAALSDALGKLETKIAEVGAPPLALDAVDPLDDADDQKNVSTTSITR